MSMVFILEVIRDTNGNLDVRSENTEEVSSFELTNIGAAMIGHGLAMVKRGCNLDHQEMEDEE